LHVFFFQAALADVEGPLAGADLGVGEAGAGNVVVDGGNGPLDRRDIVGLKRVAKANERGEDAGRFPSTTRPSSAAARLPS
jgi:hypothetical protein